jgi:hypothetical protein
MSDHGPSMGERPTCEVPEPRTRARWLHVSEVDLLRMWGREVKRAFNGEMPYLVGARRP